MYPLIKVFNIDFHLKLKFIHPLLGNSNYFYFILQRIFKNISSFFLIIQLFYINTTPFFFVVLIEKFFKVIVSLCSKKKIVIVLFDNIILFNLNVSFFSCYLLLSYSFKFRIKGLH